MKKYVKVWVSLICAGHLAGEPLAVKVAIPEPYLAIDQGELSPHRYFVSILHPDDGQICRILYRVRPEEIIDLYTTQKHRGKGYASLLLECVLDAMREAGCPYVDLEAQPEVDPSTFNYNEHLQKLEQLIEFYGKRGARVIWRGTWHVVMRFDLNQR